MERIHIAAIEACNETIRMKTEECAALGSVEEKGET